MPISAYQFNMLLCDVYVVSEWKDNAVFRREKVGQVVSWSNPDNLPFRVESGAILVVPT